MRWGNANNQERIVILQNLRQRQEAKLGGQDDEHYKNFRVRIDSAFRQVFEDLFSSVALHRIHEAAGFISASIHKPTIWHPDEYAMVSQWENEESLKAFFGETWNQCVVTRGGEKFIVACWVHHYESWDQA